ncbi:IclR family transcriptional regulator [Microbacterium marinilacus]|uniref:IclR family transcriptional regulator n=1 Tax=Microbacterium marinilacus TaxID=415209 RepID=A0ABP7BYC5_9MICO|nr:IclR family transcriptional regulator [Microbacterium marinilacus]MBY0688087.1 IclR family transcriptional regulator [Microbacterium marinilacus]
MVEDHAPVAGASHKTLRVLEAALLAERFTDIVEGSGLPKSTVHRILATLVDEGFVAGDAEGGYRAGPRFMTLAGRALSGLDISRLAQPVVDRLVADVDCTVHVGVVSGDEMVYIIRTDSSKPYRMRSRVGLAIPMHSTGMGKAALASWSDDAVAGYARRTGLPARTPATLTDPDALRAALAGVREAGYALDLGENEQGTVCVAAPIRDHTGRVTHGLSVSSIALEHPGRSIERLAPPAIAAAAEISALLGAPA